MSSYFRLYFPLILKLTLLFIYKASAIHFTYQEELIDLFNLSQTLSSIDDIKTSSSSSIIPQLVLPDLTNITDHVSKDSFFFDQNTVQRKAVSELEAYLFGLRDKSDLQRMAIYLRDHSELNPNLWVRAVLRALINRKDRTSFRIPALLEAKPDLALPSEIISLIKQESQLPPHKRKCVTVDDTTGRDNGQENLLWYFREDVMLNSHHWFWHLYNPFEKEVDRDRRGELFFFLHHNIIARYNAERLSNSLDLVVPLKIGKHANISEGYNPHLTDLNSGKNWAARPPRLHLSDNLVSHFGNTTIGKIISHRNQIESSIEKGYLELQNGSHLLINNSHGIDAVANAIEASVSSVNPTIYGDKGYHNSGHLFFGNILHPHDPHGSHPSGVMSESATAMRDVLFYRFHIHIDDMFKRHKDKLPRYKPNEGEFELSWPGVYIHHLNVKSKSSLELNILKTFWSTSKYDLANSIDFKRNQTKGKVEVCTKHLKHEDFVYNIEIINANAPTKAAVRLFLAPRYSREGVRYTMEQQHRLFFVMDTFSINLDNGKNSIMRKSTDSALTITFKQSLQEINTDQNRTTVYCGCGWPNYLLLPKGTESGMTFDLFAMVTEELDENFPPMEAKVLPADGQRICQESYLFCGVLNEKYPDSKPMGYPFDRKPYGGQDLEEYIKYSSNMATTQVKIFHNSDTRQP